MTKEIFAKCEKCGEKRLGNFFEFELRVTHKEKKFYHKFSGSDAEELIKTIHYYDILNKENRFLCNSCIKKTFHDSKRNEPFFIFVFSSLVFVGIVGGNLVSNETYNVTYDAGFYIISFMLSIPIIISLGLLYRHRPASNIMPESDKIEEIAYEYFEPLLKKEYGEIWVPKPWLKFFWGDDYIYEKLDKKDQYGA